MKFNWKDNLNKKIVLNSIDYDFARKSYKSWIHRRNIHPLLRSFLNFLKNILKYILDKKHENDRLNEEILVSMGLESDADFSDLDAVYKKEFRKKKYIYLYKGNALKKKETPPEFLFEYIPKEIQESKTFAINNIFKNFCRFKK